MLCVAGIGSVPVLAGLLLSEVSVAKGLSNPGPMRIYISLDLCLVFRTRFDFASRDRVSSRPCLFFPALRSPSSFLLLPLHFGGSLYLFQTTFLRHTALLAELAPLFQELHEKLLWATVALQPSHSPYVLGRRHRADSFGFQPPSQLLYSPSLRSTRSCASSLSQFRYYLAWNPLGPGYANLSSCRALI